MNGFKLLVLPAQKTLEMHQTTGVVRNQVLRPRFHGRGRLGFSHGCRDHREFDGKGAPETAATGLILHLQERETLHSLKQLAWLTFNLQFAQAMTTVMEGDPGREAAAEFGDP